MQVKVKKVYPDAILPAFQRKGDAALDFYSYDNGVINPGERKIFRTGIALELPDGYALMFWDRGGLSFKHGLKSLGGLTDSNFRGDINVCLLNTSNESYAVKKGDRIIQGVIQKIENEIELESVSDLSDSERGTNWQGSSGY